MVEHLVDHPMESLVHIVEHYDNFTKIVLTSTIRLWVMILVKNIWLVAK